VLAMASSDAAAVSGRPSSSMRSGVRRRRVPAMVMTPIACPSLRNTGAAIAVMPGAYISTIMLKPRLRSSSRSFASALNVVGEVVMTAELTPFLNAAMARGCPVQVGTDMLFEMIPPYLEFFGFPTTTPAALRAVARLQN
jgi:hypothetical protein